MKKISILFTTALMTIIMLMSLSVFAADEEFAGYWDFDDYTAGIASMNPDRPDRFVATPEVVEGYWTSVFGSADCTSEGRGRVLAITAGEVLMKFDDWLTDGKIHISYDARATDIDMSMMTHFWTNYAGTGVPYNQNYAKPFYLRNGQLQYYKPLEQWGGVTYDSDFDYTKWHHYDIIGTGITEKGSYISIYVDGKLIDKQLYLTNSQGIYGVSFRVSKGSDETEGAFYVDNLNVRHYYNDDALALTSPEGVRVDSTSKKIRVRLSEKVDEALLTDGNITVSASGGNPSYHIENVFDMGFDIVFDGNIPYGKYTINLADSIKGNISGTSVKYPLVIRTEEQWSRINASYIDSDFNSYTDTAALPEGVLTSNADKNAFAFSEKRNTSGSDRAFGIKGFEGSTRNITTLTMPFDSLIEGDTDYSIEFDVKSKNIKWWFYIKEAGDITANKNRAAIGSDENGVLKYTSGSDKSTVSDSITDGDITLNNDWHTIKIDVKPNKADKKTSYDIYIDGTKYTVQTERRFYEIATEGVAFGYNERGADSELYIDNVKVSGEMNVKLPEVEDITFYDANDNIVRVGDSVTTMVTKAVIKFNTYITPNFYDYVKLYIDSEETDYDCDLVRNDDKSNSIVINFNDMLLPLRKYVVSVDKGLPSAVSNTAKTYISESVKIYTGKDSGFEINKLEYDITKGNGVLEFVKNNNDSGNYIFAMCAYKNVTVPNGDGTKTVKKLIDVNLMPVEIKAEDLGLIKYELPLSDDAETADEIIPYLWNYPTLSAANL